MNPLGNMRWAEITKPPVCTDDLYFYREADWVGHKTVSPLAPGVGRGDNPENTKLPYHPFFWLHNLVRHI